MVVSFFFYKQKTAYEVRISDGSADVCSSDLRTTRTVLQLARMAAVSGLVALTLGIAKDARAVDWRTVTAPAATDRLEAQAPVLSAGGGATRDTAPGPAEYREPRSEEHTSELQSLMRNSYAVFCLQKKKKE